MDELNTKLRPLDRLWRLLKPEKKEIKNVYIYAIFHGLVYLSLPLGVQAIINLIQGGRISTSWVILVIIVTLGVAATGILQIFQLRIVENLQQRIFSRAAFEFAYRVPRIKVEELLREYAPELMNRFFDIVTIQKGLSKILIEFSAASIQIIFGLILLSLYHPFFILFSLLLIFILYVIFRLTAKKGLRTSLEESKYKFKMVHWLEEVARTNSTFKLSGRCNLPLERTDQHVNRYLKARESHFQILVSQFSLMVVFKVLVTLGLLAIGGILVMEQLMNIGQFVAAEIIILMVIDSVDKLIRSLEIIYDVLTGLEKVGNVTDLELENREGLDMSKECLDKGMKVEMVDLTFSYPLSNKKILKNINLSIPQSSITVLVGKNGSGKSTMIRLLAGLFKIDEGQILYDNINKENFSAESLYSSIGDFLTQEELFEGTILENITMGKKIALERVNQVLKVMHLSDFIRRQKNGFETILFPRGSGLAESTVKKLLLTRAILNAPKLILLEDNLDGIDHEEKCKIIDYICDPMHEWTVIAATKNDYFIRKAEQVIELDEGSINFNGSGEAYLNQRL